MQQKLDGILRFILMSMVDDDRKATKWEANVHHGAGQTLTGTVETGSDAFWRHNASALHGVVLMVNDGDPNTMPGFK